MDHNINVEKVMGNMYVVIMKAWTHIMFMLEIHMVNEFMMRFTDKKHLMLIETYWEVSRMETRGNLFDHMDTYNMENKY
ncbi:hypothetical protein AcV5_009923 [Taiwanofungus camphoratus]|nr:hypothetical protein AcV5_009923 [Antrodia cinnamomea]